MPKMLRNIVELECKIENRIIRLTCDPDCPLTHLKEALFQYQKYIGQIEDQVKASEEKSANEKVIEESKEEPDIPCTSEHK